jgi:pheromone alpha factor receptor
MPVVVTIFLPLSSMWASFNPINGVSAANQRQNDVYRPNMTIGQETNPSSRNAANNVSATTSASTGASTFASDKRRLNASFNTQGTLVNSSVDEALNNPHNLGPSAFAGVNHERDSLELEMRQHGIGAGGGGGVIKQGRSYSVRSD